jgi:hypothetical protein
MDNIKGMSQEELNQLFQNYGVILNSAGCEYAGTVAMPNDCYFVNSFDAVYKHGTILFHHLSMRWNEYQKEWWAHIESITLSQLKVKYLEQTGKKFRLSPELQAEIRRQKDAHAAETADFRWRLQWKGVVKRENLQLPSPYQQDCWRVGRVRIHDRSNPNGLTVEVKIFHGKTKKGRKTLEVVVKNTTKTPPGQ